MALPDVTVTVKDGGLGILPIASAKSCATLGVCSAGNINQLYGFSDLATLQATLGSGPLVEAVAIKLGLAGGPQYAMPLNPSAPGAVGAVTKTGTGAATVTPAVGPSQAIVAAVSTPGPLGTMRVTFAIGGGAASLPVLSDPAWAATGYLVPSTNTRLTFPAGAYSADNVYTASTTATAVAATGTAPPAVTQASTPTDAFNVQIEYTTPGAPGTGAIKYSVDGGNIYSGSTAIPGSGLLALPGTGIFLTIAGSGNLGDRHTFATTQAGYSGSDVTAAGTALLADSTGWRFGHLVGQPANAAGAASLASTVDTIMQLAKSQNRFVRFVTECPSTEGDTAIKSAFANFGSDTGRVTVFVGDADVISPISSRHFRRNGAWLAVARAAAVNPGHDPAHVALGPLGGVGSLYFNSFADGGVLDDARFSTLGTLIGKQGYFVINMKTMAPSGSDFTYWALGRVIDEACTIARAALLPYLSAGVRVDKTTGLILPEEADHIERAVNAQLKAGVVDTGDASAAYIQLSRTENILSSSRMPTTCAVVPLAYTRAIPLTVGFQNPALALAA